MIPWIVAGLLAAALAGVLWHGAALVAAAADKLTNLRTSKLRAELVQVRALVHITRDAESGHRAAEERLADDLRLAEQRLHEAHQDLADARLQRDRALEQARRAEPLDRAGARFWIPPGAPLDDRAALAQFLTRAASLVLRSDGAAGGSYCERFTGQPGPAYEVDSAEPFHDLPTADEAAAALRAGQPCCEWPRCSWMAVLVDADGLSWCARHRAESAGGVIAERADEDGHFLDVGRFYACRACGATAEATSFNGWTHPRGSCEHSGVTLGRGFVRAIGGAA